MLKISVMTEEEKFEGKQETCQMETSIPLKRNMNKKEFVTKVE